MSSDVEDLKINDARQELRIDRIEENVKGLGSSSKDVYDQVQELHFAIDTLVVSVAGSNKAREELDAKVIKHMEEESAENKVVKDTISKILTGLAVLVESHNALATKEEVAITNGNVKTMKVVGTSVVAVLLGVVMYGAIWIRDDLKGYIESVKKHTTEASKMNYNGTKRLIEKHDGVNNEVKR